MNSNINYQVISSLLADYFELPSLMLAEKVQQLPQERVLKKRRRFRGRATRTNAMSVLGWLLKPALTSCLLRYCLNQFIQLVFSLFIADVLITQLVFSEDLMEALEEAKAVSTPFLSLGYWLTICTFVSSELLKSYVIHDSEAFIIKTRLLHISVLLFVNELQKNGLPFKKQKKFTVHAWPYSISGLTKKSGPVPKSAAFPTLTEPSKSVPSFTGQLDRLPLRFFRFWKPRFLRFF